ncbi:MAG: hypothetical protein AAGH65_00815 [Pseudomonadota bacterium]
MSILALLMGLLISHFIPHVRAFRIYAWLIWPAAWTARFVQSDGPDWLPMLTLLLSAMIGGGLMAQLAEATLGPFGLLIVSILIVVYTLGPRDLDQDVEHALSAESSRWALQLPEDANGVQAAGAVLHAALARWFGVMFWFVLLGIPGALLYRAARVASRQRLGNEHQQRWFDQLLFVLNWPVLLLMTVAVALMTDFDRVLNVWRRFQDRWRIRLEWLDQLANALCTPDCDPQQGLHEGQDLAWRMLWVWLAVLSVLLLAGWVQ